MTGLDNDVLPIFYAVFDNSAAMYQEQFYWRAAVICITITLVLFFLLRGRFDAKKAFLPVGIGLVATGMCIWLALCTIWDLHSAHKSREKLLSQEHILHLSDGAHVNLVETQRHAALDRAPKIEEAITAQVRTSLLQLAKDQDLNISIADRQRHGKIEFRLLGEGTATSCVAKLLKVEPETLVDTLDTDEGLVPLYRQQLKVNLTCETPT